VADKARINSFVLQSVVQGVMLASSRGLGSLACLLGIEGARISRKRAERRPSTKFLAGVPVLNYDAAYAGQPTLSEEEGIREEEWVVMLKQGTSTAELATLCASSSAKHGCRLTGHPTEGGLPFLELRGTEGDLEALIRASHGGVRYIEPDQKVQMVPEIAATDVEASTWGLDRIGADGRSRTGGGATIYVLDTGIRVSHQEFSGRASGALDMASGDPVECRGDASCAADMQGHGTHCAGSAAGVSYGVAPQAAVKAIKVLDDQGYGSWSSSYYALDWLAASTGRPAIASMSLGGPGQQRAMQDAVESAVNAGIVVSVAAGNDNDVACSYSPAFVPSAITVGSTTSLDARSSFSNYGRCVNIWAPGSDVVSAGIRSDTDSDTLSGTSMACPHVSGAAALVLAGNPNMKPSAVMMALIDAAASNMLTGLKGNDLNKLLYVADGGAPPGPAPPPGSDKCPWHGCVFGCGVPPRGGCEFCARCQAK